MGSDNPTVHIAGSAAASSADVQGQASHVFCALCARQDIHVMEDSHECRRTQQSTGCHACGSFGCWKQNPCCPFYERSREPFRDAEAIGEAADHIFEREMVAFHHPGTGKGRRAVLSITIGSQLFKKGEGSPVGHNCLLDSLQQCVNIHIRCKANLAWVRKQLRLRFPSTSDNPVFALTYLDLRSHWEDAIRFMGISSADRGYPDARIAPETFTVVAVAYNHDRVVEQVGTGPTRLHVLNENFDHFVPLFPSS